MKKGISLVLGVAFIAALGFTSCRKQHTCVCTVNGQKVEADYPRTLKKTAQSSCESLESSYKMYDDPAASCSLD